MTYGLVIVAVVAFCLGYAAALALSRSRVRLARNEAQAESRDQLVAARMRLEHLQSDLRTQAARIAEVEGALDSSRHELSQAREEVARTQMQVSALREDKERLGARTGDLESALEAASSSLGDQTTRVASLEAALLAEQRRSSLLEGQTKELAEEGRRSLAALTEARSAMATAQTQAAEALATLEARTRERDALSNSAEAQAQELQALRRDLLEKSRSLATLESQFEGFQQTAAARLEALSEAQARLGETFRSLSAEALQANNAAFLQLAGTQMEGHQAQAAQDLEARQLAIAGLMQPVQTGLAAMQEQVQSLAHQRATAEATLTTQIQTLVETQAGLQAETGKLASALRKPEVKGQWGEVQLRNVVEYAGMTEHVDFEMQGSLEGEDSKLRPDLMVNLPGRKRIAVDAKAPLRAYLEALEAEGPAREAKLQAVAAQVRTQVTNLGDKRYFSGLTESPDFVVLFLPLEALFSIALQHDPRLLDYALSQHVILASPTTLVALLQAAAYGWGQERIQANAEEIQKLGNELLDRITLMAAHTDNLRKALQQSVDAFNQFAGSLEGRVMVSAQRLHDLGIRPATKRKPRPLGLRAPQAIHADLSGLPKLGIKGEAPPIDIEAVEYDREEGLELKDSESTPR